jgi:hypothetical protein
MWRSALRDAARRPVGGDAVASSDVPTSPASRLVVRDTRRDALDALEMHVSVYNLPSALTRRTPRVFVALLVEAPPAAKVPTHRGSRTTGASPGASSTPTRAPRDAPSSLAARHRDWIVAGCTEPVVVPTNARATRFCVPVRVDGLAGPLDRGHLQRLRDKSKKIALALYRVPDADDADDVYVFADENLPKHTRGVLTTTRLDDMEYLGETAVDLGKVLSSIADKSGAAGAVKHSAARDHYALTKNPARDSLESLSSRLEGDDVVDDARRIATATPPSAPRHKSRLRPTASAPAGLEILAAAPLTHPPLPPKETGRVVVDLLVLFPPPRIDVDKLTAVETHSAYVRLCRWVGDGYQPVYSSLVCGSEEDVAVEPFVSERDGNETETGDDVPGTREKNYRRSSTLVARIPTMHVPIGCLRGGGGSSQEPGSMLPMREPVSKSGSSTSPSASRAKENDTKTFRETHYPLPSPDAAWRLEMVARLADGRDALVGAAELTFGELVAAGVRASLGDGPAALRCDELDARDGADFDVSSPFEKQTRAVFLVERWAVRAGTRARQTWGGLRGQSRFVLDGGNEDTTRASASRAKAPFASRDDDDDDDDDAAALKRTGGGATSAERAGSPSNLSTWKAGDKKPPRRSWTPSDSELDSSSDSEREGTPHMMTETKGFLHIARQKGRFTPPRRAKEKVETERKTETIMTPTRALLERARVSLRRREKVPKSPVDDATVAASAAATSRALGLGGRDANANANAAKVSPKVLTDSVNTVCHSAAETKFRPDPRLVAAADDAVRSAISDRLQSETRGELIESALRVRRELLKKLSGELRYLEQRARREARVAGGGVWGRHTASSAAARRNKSSVAGTGTMVGRDRT